MRRRYRLLMLGCLSGAAASCAVAHEARPLGAGRSSVGVSAGGPIIDNLTLPLVVPHVVVQGRYGVGPHTDIDAGLHLPLTPAMGLDMGAAHLIWQQRNKVPALMLGGRLLVFGNAQSLRGNAPLEPRLFEEGYGLLSWRLATPYLVYTGLDAFAQLERGIVRPSLLAGATWQPTGRWHLTAEVSWMACATWQRALAVHYWGVGNVGAWGVHLGAAYLFGDVS